LDSVTTASQTNHKTLNSYAGPARRVVSGRSEGRQAGADLPGSRWRETGWAPSPGVEKNPT